jgi:hypothetical protein
MLSKIQGNKKFKSIKKFCINYWSELIIFFLTISIFIFLALPFFLNNSLDKFDHPGLLSLSWFIKEYALPNFKGWNPYFFGGIPQGTFYPPLFHYIVAILSTIFNITVAYKLVISIAVLFTPYIIYEFSLLIYKQKLWSILNTLLILFSLITLPGYLGFNFDGLFDYGLSPNFFTIPLFFLYLKSLFAKKKNILVISILFSIILLTNLVTAFIISFITIVFFLLNFKDKKIIILLIKSFIIIILLTSFWIIPYISFYKYTATGYSFKSNFIFSAFSFFISFILIVLVLSKYKTNSNFKFFINILTCAFFFSCVSLFDAYINRSSTKISLPPIHPYRLQIYSLVLITICLTFLIQNFHPLFIKFANKLIIIKYFQKQIHIAMMLTLLILAFLILIKIRLNPYGVEEVKLIPKIEWTGRVIRGYKVTDILDQSRAVIDKALMQNPTQFAVDGLLKESSYLAPYFQSLSKNMNTDIFNWEELDSYYIENKKLSEEKTNYLSNLLWVKYMFVIDKKYPETCNLIKKISSFNTNTKDEGIVKRDINLCLYEPSRNSSIIEKINEKPKIISSNWNKEIEKWWFSDETILYTDKEIPDFKSSAFIDRPKVEFRNNYKEIYISKNSSEKAYYLLKLSFFPKWQAYDESGNKVNIYRTSPNLMIIPIKDYITLKYETTKIEHISNITSIISFLFLGILIINKRYKFMKLNLL